MNGKKAKALRKRIYGEQSIKTREYDTIGKTVVCVGLRREYQDAKKA